MTDPIADMLTRIRNASRVGKAEVILPYSKYKQQLGELLKKQGLVEEVFDSTEDDKKQLGIKLRYSGGQPVITGLKRVSSPGQRIYSKSKDIPRTQNGYGITVVSTSQGLLTDTQARKNRLGGEIICQIW
ncbi:MAG: 30S ribosomal protein S8 [Candidatus Doudnabacteria bacterium RIFCSPHIGHO2_01_FULL_43_23]|uniref:Small ribosomal subunit protein uS8 n=1 Tax=Candidatus Doudnabacteria bacterium RIFCSPHIGHO2_01_FULL_43_23 TaxID=1817822 RepID=A0A1F5NWF7_9BACT|nr:ribosomal protein S8 [uncultured bacterium]OGE81660.1 MAG: 30S ribosomal protein S8 [Candidatus Doudnabacteria bacterium RIFCSPHIGHO2_01_FULL_43_23]